MKKGKRVMAGLVVSAMGLTSLAACSQTSPTATSTQAETKAGDQTRAGGEAKTTTQAQEATTEPVKESDAETTGVLADATEAVSPKEEAGENEYAGADDQILLQLRDKGLIPEEPVTLDVYAQLAGREGEVEGWYKKVLLDKFNVKLNVIYGLEQTYNVRKEEGKLGDIIIMSSSGDDYQDAAASGLLLNWDKAGLLDSYGTYIKDHMKDALEANRAQNPDGALYGFGSKQAFSPKDHEAVWLTWDIRWDLYQKLGYPQVSDLDDYMSLLLALKDLNVTDDEGSTAYAVSFWNDWDSAMVMNVKNLAMAYWGLEEKGMGLYDAGSGEYYDTLMPEGPYLKMLAFCHALYQNGLLDPDSRTQVFETAFDKAKKGGVLTSVCNFAGSMLYNSGDHAGQEKFMAPLPPSEASPLVTGLGTGGDDVCWAIGAQTEYPELCMALLSYLATPDGTMEFCYGPKSEEAVPEARDGCWYYKDGMCCLTDLGRACRVDLQTPMSEALGSKTFEEGLFPVNSRIWHLDATNPVTGERYNAGFWRNEQPEASCDTEKDWRSYMAGQLGLKEGSVSSVNEYYDLRNMSDDEGGLTLVEPIMAEPVPEELSDRWEAVSRALVEGSWAAVYAESDEEYERIVSEMTDKCKSLGYEACVDWSKT